MKMPSKRKLMPVMVWWFIVGALVGYILLADGPRYMPGPLEPGQERPTY